MMDAVCEQHVPLQLADSCGESEGGRLSDLKAAIRCLSPARTCSDSVQLSTVKCLCKAFACGMKGSGGNLHSSRSCGVDGLGIASPSRTDVALAGLLAGMGIPDYTSYGKKDAAFVGDEGFA